MDPTYARHYEDLFRRHWWWRARELFILDALRRHLGAGRDRRLLDVGCGNGLFFDALAAFGEVEGIEADPEIVDRAGPHAGRIHLGFFDATFRPDRCYDAILFLDVLEHLSDPQAALARALELLAPGGRIIVTVPALPALWTAHDDFNHHLVRFTRRSFAGVHEGSDLRIEESRYFFHWTAPLKLGVRAWEALRLTRPTPERVPPAFVNRALYGLSRLEQILLGSLRLPFGTSLLFVGRRAREASI